MNNIKIERISFLNEKDMKQIIKVWEKSVRATHCFLSEEDIKDLKPLVKIGLTNVEELLCVRDESRNIQAFMGIAQQKIEMLFISPILRGKGIGKLLISYAVNKFNAKYVDVNEENTQALGFYEHLGFIVFARDEFDAQGNPFPILHMKKEIIK